MSLLAISTTARAPPSARRALSTVVLTHPVGSQFEYSNLKYILLGLIVEAASGESYADYIYNHIFVPLGMRHSYTSQAMAKQNQ
jgi:CubicO group peptidase (beta-lactamase class C family)